MGDPMCGRYALHSPGKAVADLFGLIEEPILQPRYNVAPTQPVPVIRIKPRTGRRELALLHWGLVPSWADAPGIGNRLVNARAETLAIKPSFRRALQERRCLVPADGFYEWKRNGRQKQPVYIRRKDGQLLALAGLWEDWHRDESAIESCAIVTTESHPHLAAYHDRMPAILDPKDYDLWLDASLHDPRAVMPLLRPCAGEDLEVFSVGLQVNDARYDDPKCVERIA